MSDVLTQLKALDAMTAEGKILETLDIYFADDCRFIEVINGDSRDSLKAQHAHLSGFFATLKGFNGATLRGHAVNGDQSFSEWTFDMVAGDGSSIVWNEVLVRRWKDGKVIEEKYYNASA